MMVKNTQAHGSELNDGLGVGGILGVLSGIEPASPFGKQVVCDGKIIAQTQYVEVAQAIANLINHARGIDA